MPEKMKAARFYKVGEPLKIDLIPVPRLGSEDVLVNIKACGICGSDIHIVYEGVTPTAYSPITLGHEPSGVIAALGSRGQRLESWRESDDQPFSYLREMYQLPFRKLTDLFVTACHRHSH